MLLIGLLATSTVAAQSPPRGSLFALPAWELPGEAAGVVAADLDRDGRLDVVVALEDLDALSFSEAGGDGGFGAPTIVRTVASPRDVTVAEVGASSLGVFLTEAAGVGPRLTVPLAGPPGPIAAGDLNGDGADDLVVAFPGSGAVQALHAAGHGVFLPGPVLRPGPGVRDLLVADVFGEGPPRSSSRRRRPIA